MFALKGKQSIKIFCHISSEAFKKLTNGIKKRGKCFKNLVDVCKKFKTFGQCTFYGVANFPFVLKFCKLGKIILLYSGQRRFHQHS